jgi:predicted ArsR family transcriptional regulator
VDRLPVFKALGDNTRYAIYLELARSTRPLGTSDVADALGLHPNTVRPHLERMREVGLLDVETDTRGQVGRPQHRYSLAVDAPSLGLEPSTFRMLARMLAGVAAKAGLQPDDVADVGRLQGRADAADHRSADHNASEHHGARTCAAALMAELAELGFDPAAVQDGNTTTIAFTHCPFQELAQAFPELVCHLHRGIVEGFVDARGGAEVTAFATLADRDPCRVDLTSR